jgi:hypothetical protein
MTTKLSACTSKVQSITAGIVFPGKDLVTPSKQIWFCVSPGMGIALLLFDKPLLNQEIVGDGFGFTFFTADLIV